MDKKKMKLMPKTARILKVCSGNDFQYRPIPVIRLQGKWLKDFGFEIGDKVVVKCQMDRLEITKSSDEEKV